MTTKEKIKKDIIACIEQSTPILLWLQDKLEVKAEQPKPKEKSKVKTKENLKEKVKEKPEVFSFHHEYQKWYTMALKIVQHLAPDRYPEFKSYYEIDHKRKILGYGTYVIQDYLKGVAPRSTYISTFDTKGEVFKCVYNQYTILNSIYNRVDSVLNDIHSSLYAELQDTEIGTAKSLLKINIRAAGVIAGVVLENYLQRIVENHKLLLGKKNPTLANFNDLLKSSQIYDIIVWRKISYLADVRNTCAHNTDTEPKKDQVAELIEGVQWVSKNVF